MATEQQINDLLYEYGKFTKEEAELILSMQEKKRAKHDNKIYEKYAETDGRYIQKYLMLSKNKDLSKAHKELTILSAQNEFNAHKDILLQCIATLQNLVQNPNMLTDLKDLINSDWGGGQSLKEKIFMIIDNHENKINEIHTELYNLRNTPLILFLPELYACEYSQISKLPSYDATISRQINDWLEATNNKIPYLP